MNDRKMIYDAKHHCWVDITANSKLNKLLKESTKL